jgi:hypothetical protein
MESQDGLMQINWLPAQRLTLFGCERDRFGEYRGAKG